MKCLPLLRSRGYVLGLSAIALAIAVGWYLLDGTVGYNLADEGFLWYGSEALLRGEVPMRDFESYDPGRYVWTAAWSLLLGHDIMALRLACVFFQCLGVLAGLLTLRRASRHWLFLGGAALLLSIWMHPRYKLFEQSIALMAVYAAVLLLERPTLRRHFAVGVFGGICAIFGRNHGAYHLAAFGLLITFAGFSAGGREWFRRSTSWGAGFFLGYLPQLLMFAFVPGFWRAYMPYLYAVADKGVTNLARPVHWPWLVGSDLPLLPRLSMLAEGCGYAAVLAFLVVAAFRAWQLRKEDHSARWLVVAAGCVALPYAHFVFSRPDIVHLAHAAPVVAVGLLALAFSLAGRGRRAGYALLPVLVVWSLLAQLSQIGLAFEYLAPEKSLFAVNVNGYRMVMGTAHARALASAHHLARDLAKPDEAIFFAPHAPGLYPFTGRPSPTNQIYFVFPATPETDQRLVDDLERANLQWAMIEDIALDDREDLRFVKTNPLVCDYLRRNFRPVPLATLPLGTLLLHRSAGATAALPAGANLAFSKMNAPL